MEKRNNKVFEENINNWSPVMESNPRKEVRMFIDVREVAKYYSRRAIRNIRNLAQR